YTAIGDTVNVASRVEGLTKQLGATVLATETTRERAREAFTWIPHPEAHVKGKSGTVLTFTPVAAHAAG
ncbi:MAG TPA: adenylate/guanylate cyclase domain-containing protein, partial [Usitatibacter sp.]|nr:adenylate/guanylate cyclase domain-containing protein [Usitatibacter sp.]